MITLMIPAAAGVIVNAVLDTGDTKISLEQAVIFLGIAFTIGAICNAIRATTFTLAGERVVARMRKQLFGSLVKQETAFYDVTRTGELTNRLSADTVRALAILLSLTSTRTERPRHCFSRIWLRSLLAVLCSASDTNLAANVR